MKSLENKFEVGQEVYMLTINRDDVIPVRVHMVRAEWHPYGFTLQYDVYPTKAGRYIPMGEYLQHIGEEYLFNKKEDAMKMMKSKRTIAREKLNNMKLHECIGYWNEKSGDHYHRLTAIHPMEDEERWNYLAGEIGAWDFFHQLSNSSDFNDSDKFFGYIEDGCEFFSFSTRQELMEYLEDWFIDELTEELNAEN